ncbi:MAG: hypothetical protein AAF641_01610 [Pseudomonadota bacterium]
MDTNRRFAISALALAPIGLGMWWLSPVRTATPPEATREPVEDAVAQTVDPEVIDAGLKLFLASRIMTPAMRCGARRGDGAPAYAQVEALQMVLSGSPHSSAEDIAADLEARHETDLSAARVTSVDGWIMTETEALSASLAMLKQDQDCVQSL